MLLCGCCMRGRHVRRDRGRGVTWESCVCARGASGRAGTCVPAPPTARSLDGGRATVLPFEEQEVMRQLRVLRSRPTRPTLSRMKLLSLHQR